MATEAKYIVCISENERMILAAAVKIYERLMVNTKVVVIDDSGAEPCVGVDGKLQLKARNEG